MSNTPTTLPLLNRRQTSAKTSLFSCTHEDFANKVFMELGRGRQQASSIYKHLHHTYGYIQQECNDPCFQNCPHLKKEIFQKVDSSIPFIKIPAIYPDGQVLDPRELVQQDSLIIDKICSSTTKFLTILPSELEIESVLIPMQHGLTLCVSSQVGCSMGCRFCETARLGLLQQLSVQQICSQLAVANILSSYKVRNIVFMGMGEPLDNTENVLKSIEVMTDPKGFSIAPKRITLSTSGHLDGMEKLIEKKNQNLRLAISLHAPNDIVRTRLMPINRKWKLEQLKNACVKWQQFNKHPILIEYIMLKGINDRICDAQELIQWCQGLKVKVNLIPYNPQSKTIYYDSQRPLEASDPQIINKFMDYLRTAKLTSLLRHHKGRDQMAACGQLGNLDLRKKIKERHCYGT